MAAQRFSRPHKWILRWVAADHQRTQGRTTGSHQDLGESLAGDKSTMSRSWHTLEKQGWVVIPRASGGKADSLSLTSEGLQRASEIGRKLLLRHRTRKNNVLWVKNQRWSQPVYNRYSSCLKERHIVRRVSAFNRRKYPLTERMSWHGLARAPPGGQRF
jgi:DNA-binding MarR family transcriptional regulator